MRRAYGQGNDSSSDGSAADNNGEASEVSDINGYYSAVEEEEEDEWIATLRNKRKKHPLNEEQSPESDPISPARKKLKKRKPSETPSSARVHGVSPPTSSASKRRVIRDESESD